MKKLFACLLMVGSAGLASAQVSNFRFVRCGEPFCSLYKFENLYPI